MKVVIDMNLSPSWREVFRSNDVESVHWSEIGHASAEDSEILGWARDNDYIVFTHDLDFGAILAATKANAPSVVQVREQDVAPKHMGEQVIEALREYAQALESGALLI